MKFFGLLVGLIFGVLSGLLFHLMALGTTGFSFFAAVMPVVNAVAAALGALVPSLPPLPTAILMFVLWLLFNLLVIGTLYLLANAGYTKAVMDSGWAVINPGDPPKTDANNTFAFIPSTVEQFVFGFFLGAASATNFVLWWLVTSIPLAQVMALLALLPLLVLFTALARSHIVQALVGWTGWVMPLAWLPSVIGLLTFVPLAIIGIVQHGLDALRIDPTSGALETHVDYSSIPGIPPLRGFTQGLFSFVKPTATTPSPKRFLERSTSAHESAHVLCIAAFGGVFWLANFIDQILLRAPANARFSLGELYAESRAPGSVLTAEVAGVPGLEDYVNAYLPLWGA
jgi:hypothetical protein